MTVHKFEIVYSRQTHDFAKGRAYSNPRFFTTPRSGVTKVYIAGHYPNIEQAYKNLGVPVERIDEEAMLETGEVVITAEPHPMTGKPEDHNQPNYSNVEIPEDWRDLPWVGDPSIRTLASRLSDSHIINKAQAVAVITAELARRDSSSDNGDN